MRIEAIKYCDWGMRTGAPEDCDVMVMRIEALSLDLYGRILVWDMRADPTDIFKGKLKQLFGQALRHGILSKKEVDFQTTDHPVVHKSLADPPGRPIVFGVNGLFENPCTYLDFFLQPMAMTLMSFIRDSTHLIQLLFDFYFPPDTILITLDVEFLYTSINHDIGLKSVSFFLELNTTGDREHDQFLLDLLFFVLFSF
ncbi:unnamed protein product [Ranitomeya imitator]|uniref:Uncharacterized protein n=1 Tax=Ranitomeya imitator TaxID=111125 RepID=A0ABN9M5B6_9NEOB|nr:unnamed protein product [Ranitomeya imitator]